MLQNDDGEDIHIPMTTGRMPLFNPDIIPAGYLLYITGAFDDVSGEKRGEGAQMELEVTYDAGPTQGTLQGQFFEHQYVVGGEFGCHDEELGDWASMMAYAPASAPTSTPGTGNANKVDTGLGFNIIVPAPGDDGDWTVDGSTLWKGEINLNLVPVPNGNDPQTGYWNWDPTVDPSITPVANPGAPDGAFDLYDVQMPLVRQANRVSMLLHEKACCPANVRGKKFLPHWVMQFTVNRKTTGAVKVAFSMKFGRKLTTNPGDTIS